MNKRIFKVDMGPEIRAELDEDKILIIAGSQKLEISYAEYDRLHNRVAPRLRKWKKYQKNLSKII